MSSSFRFFLKLWCVYHFQNQIWYNFIIIIVIIITKNNYCYPRFWGCFTPPQFFPLYSISALHKSLFLSASSLLTWNHLHCPSQSAAPLTTLLRYLRHFCLLNLSSPIIKLQLGPGQNYFTQKISDFFSNHFLSCLFLFHAPHSDFLTGSLPS